MTDSHTLTFASACLAQPLTFHETMRTDNGAQLYSAPAECGVFTLVRGAGGWTLQMVDDNDALTANLGTFQTPTAAVVAAQREEDLFVARGMSTFALNAVASFVAEHEDAAEEDEKPSLRALLELCVKVKLERLDS